MLMSFDITIMDKVKSDQILQCVRTSILVMFNIENQHSYIEMV